jgi:hypothetical protein
MKALQIESHKEILKKFPSIGCTRSNGKVMAPSYESLVAMSVPGKMSPYYAHIFHICTIKKLTVLMASVTTSKL